MNIDSWDECTDYRQGRKDRSSADFAYAGRFSNGVSGPNSAGHVSTDYTD